MIKTKALPFVSSIIFLFSLTACGGTSYTPATPSIPDYTKISTTTKKTCTCKNKSQSSDEKAKTTPAWSEVDPNMVIKPSSSITKANINKAVIEKNNTLADSKLPEVKIPVVKAPTTNPSNGTKTDETKKETFFDKLKNKLSPKK